MLRVEGSGFRVQGVGFGVTEEGHHDVNVGETADLFSAFGFRI